MTCATMNPEPRDDVVDLVRSRLLAIRHRDEMTYVDIAAIVKKPNGERYTERTVASFIRNEQDMDWRPFALAVVMAFPEARKGLVCPFSDRICFDLRPIDEPT